jgi:hypothetical protein
MAVRDAWPWRGAATRNILLAGSFTLTHLATWPRLLPIEEWAARSAQR